MLQICKIIVIIQENMVKRLCIISTKKTLSDFKCKIYQDNSLTLSNRIGKLYDRYVIITHGVIWAQSIKKQLQISKESCFR